MKITPVRALVAGALCALALPARAQIVELRATINAAQETTTSTSPATGSATMFYNPATNLFDLVVTVNNMANTATMSHIHEAPAGSSAGVVTDLGAEALYTRTGNTLTATFVNKTYGGDPKKLLKGEGYYNIHSAQFPAGEVRGQLIPRPVRLYAKLDVAQEQASFPNVNLSGLNDFGGALMTYDPVTNRMTLRFSLFNFNNTLSNAHFHEGAPGAPAGPVRQNIGNSVTLPGYSTANGNIEGAFEFTNYGGDPIVLLTGGAYLNFHSTTFTGGELRGQIFVSNEIPSSRMVNVSTRGNVGTGANVLIGGFSVGGSEPVRVLVTARGPSLAQFGLSGVLSDPVLALHDSGGRRIASNDNIGTVASGSDLSGIPGVPTNASESALLVTLPPGNYTAILSGSGTATGVALLEAYDVRAIAPSLIVVSTQRAPASPTATPGGTAIASAAKAAAELCAAVPLAVAVSKR